MKLCWIGVHKWGPWFKWPCGFAFKGMKYSSRCTQCGKLCGKDTEDSTDIFV